MTLHRRDLLKGTAGAIAAAGVLSQTTAADEEWADELAREIPDADEISTATSRDGVASTAHPLATDAAIEVLEDGGNAYDAAAAAQLVLSVVVPNGTGLAAEARLHAYNAEEDNTYLVNGLGRAAGAAQPDMFLDDDGNYLGTGEIYDRGLAHGVPGSIRLLDTALKRWGTRYFDELADRAIDLAEEGWEIDRELSLRIHQTQDTLNEAARDVYLDENGDPLEPGDRLVQADKADTLRLIAEGGSGAFYRGEIAEATTDFIQEMGGITTMEDFERYQVSVGHPVWFEYDGYQVASEYNVGLAMRLLDGFDLADLDPKDPQRYHLLLEAQSRARADAGTYVNDYEYADIPQQGLLSDEYTEDRRDEIDPERATGAGAGDPWAYQPGDAYDTGGHVPQTTADVESLGAADGGDEYRTNSFVVADAEGNVVTHSSSLGVGWNAGNMVPGYGFMLSVIQSYFSPFPTDGVGDALPNKRVPMAQIMTHTIVFEDGRPILTADSPGSNQAAPLQVLLNVLEHDMDLAEAVAEPRVKGGNWEDGVPKEARDALEEMGHNLADDWSDLGSVQSIHRQDRGRRPRWTAAADARRDGSAGSVGDSPGRSN
ncbi:gamma-glutamyltransferase family protein [Natrononativus amylolyticus]|uniref:gamma-glutamyltransferase family protein n=1 Tax=Natrononativus amylolyticus TaxID=2963434 RepID=UPI0020CC22F4|nr:gamma-glutamyltransferase [Natrononativus amylolyticus]